MNRARLLKFCILHLSEPIFPMYLALYLPTCDSSTVPFTFPQWSLRFAYFLVLKYVFSTHEAPRLSDFSIPILKYHCNEHLPIFVCFLDSLFFLHSADSVAHCSLLCARFLVSLFSLHSADSLTRFSYHIHICELTSFS